MSDHTEHGRNTPIGHCLRHDVGNGGLVRRFRVDTDIDAILTHINREQFLSGILVSAGRPASLWIEIPTVPWTAQPALPVLADFDGPLAKRPALVRAAVFHCCILTIDVCQRHRMRCGRHCLDPPLGQLIDIRDAVPLQLFVRSRHCPAPSSTARSMCSRPADNNVFHRSSR